MMYHYHSAHKHDLHSQTVLLTDHLLINVSFFKDDIRVFNDIDMSFVDHDQTNLHCVDIGHSFLYTGYLEYR